MEKNVEWPEANLSRERQRLLFMEAVCGSPEAAARNIQVIDQRNKIALIERLLTADASGTSRDFSQAAELAIDITTGRDREPT